MTNARGYGIIRAALQGLGSRYFGEFSGYAFPTEQSDLVLETGYKDVVHQGPCMVGYR